jgi:hypothetical protein
VSHAEVNAEVVDRLLTCGGDRGSPTSLLSLPTSPLHPCGPLDLLSAAAPFFSVFSSACPRPALLGRAAAAKAFEVLSLDHGLIPRKVRDFFKKRLMSGRSKSYMRLN